MITLGWSQMPGKSDKGKYFSLFPFFNAFDLRRPLLNKYCVQNFIGAMFEWHFPILNLFSFDCPHVLSYGENHIINDLSYICQPYSVILTIILSSSLPLISKVGVFLLPTCVSNLSFFQAQTDGRHNFAKEGKRRKKESSWREQLLPVSISHLIHFYQSDQITISE